MSKILILIESIGFFIGLARVEVKKDVSVKKVSLRNRKSFFDLFHGSNSIKLT